MNRLWPSRLVCGLALVAAIVSAAPAQAEDSPHWGEQISKKFVRGVVNLSTGWLELPRQVYEVGQTEGWITGALRGPFDGIGMFFARTVAGVVEVATFPVPLPTYQPILTPTYAWEPEMALDVTPATGREGQ